MIHEHPGQNMVAEGVAVEPGILGRWGGLLVEA